jgi:hypothetical protein
MYYIKSKFYIECCCLKIGIRGLDDEELVTELYRVEAELRKIRQKLEADLRKRKGEEALKDIQAWLREYRYLNN